MPIDIGGATPSPDLLSSELDAGSNTSGLALSPEEFFEMSRISNGIDRRITHADKYGLPQELSQGVSGSLVHTAQGTMIHTKIITDADLILIQGADNESLAGGVKIFDVPGVKMKIHTARIAYNLTLSAAAMTTTAGEIGLGTALASGAAAVLGGTATFEDILEGGANGRDGAALANIGAAGNIVATTFDASPVTLAPVSGVANGVYLNAASAFADSDPSNLVLQAGSEIEIWWTPIDA